MPESVRLIVTSWLNRHGHGQNRPAGRMISAADVADWVAKSQERFAGIVHSSLHEEGRSGISPIPRYTRGTRQLVDIGSLAEKEVIQ